MNVRALSDVIINKEDFIIFYSLHLIFIPLIKINWSRFIKKNHFLSFYTRKKIHSTPQKSFFLWDAPAECWMHFVGASWKRIKCHLVLKISSVDSRGVVRWQRTYWCCMTRYTRNVFILVVKCSVKDKQLFIEWINCWLVYFILNNCCEAKAQIKCQSSQWITTEHRVSPWLYFLALTLLHNLRLLINRCFNC